MFTEPTQTDPEMAELEDARREVTRLEAELEAATGPEAEPSLSNRIAQAEADGRWLEAGQMKLRAKLEGEPSPEPQEESEGETIENLMAQVADAEINRDFYASGMAKVKLMNKRAAENPPDGGDIAPTPSSDGSCVLSSRRFERKTRTNKEIPGKRRVAPRA